MIASDPSRRAVVTGLGLVTPLGKTWDRFVAALMAGNTAIQQHSFAFSDLFTADSPASLVPDFVPEDDLPNSKSATMDRVTAFAVYAARQAMAQAHLEGHQLQEICLGACTGGLGSLEGGYEMLVKGATRLPPLTIPKFMSNAPASAISIDLQALAPAYCVSSACSSSSQAIILAVKRIMSGQCDIVLTGGTEASATFGHITAWRRLGVMSKDMCRPFCSTRSGMVMGEGAALFVLESLASAQARDAPILAEITGIAESSDAQSLTTPDLDNIAKTMAAAVESAGLEPGKLDHINAHGTATKMNDVVEAQAIRQAFGPATDDIQVSSTKAMHGHLLGAAGAVELAASIAAIDTGTAPPNANLSQQDPEIALNLAGSRPPRRIVKTVMTSSFAFGGHNAVMVLQAG